MMQTFLEFKGFKMITLNFFIPKSNLISNIFLENIKMSQKNVCDLVALEGLHEKFIIFGGHLMPQIFMKWEVEYHLKTSFN